VASYARIEVSFRMATTPIGSPTQPRMTRRALLCGPLVAASAGLLLAGCAKLTRLVSSSAPTTNVINTATPTSGGSLRISQPADIVPAGTPYQFTGANLHLLTLVYDTLVAYDTQLMPHPRLATGWTWSADSRRLTLTVSAADPATLVSDYDTPVKSTFDALTATYMADPMSLDDTNAGRSFVGTGPFRFQEWAAGDHATLLRNNGYWESGKPYLDQVELRITPDQQSALVALESGSVDWMAGVPGLGARRLQNDPNCRVLLTADGGYRAVRIWSPSVDSVAATVAGVWCRARPDVYVRSRQGAPLLESRAPPTF